MSAVPMDGANAKLLAADDDEISNADLDAGTRYVQLGLLMAECRRELFPSSDFSEAQWHMISHLFVARNLDGKNAVMTKELLQVSGLPQGSAWRHLTELERMGAVQRNKPKRDARRTMISLTPTYSSRVEDFSTQLEMRLRGRF